MFLAIINDTYADVKKEITQDSVPVANYIKRKLTQLWIWNKCCPCFRITEDNETNNLRTSKQLRSMKEEYISNDQIKSLDQRVEVLESDMQIILNRIDTFIKNVSRSIDEDNE